MYNKPTIVLYFNCYFEIRAEIGNKRREGKEYVRGQIER
jgi:hypothetical protein